MVAGEGRVEADLFFGLAERGRHQRLVVGVDLAAGKRKLPTVEAAIGADDQDEPQAAVLVPVHRNEDCRDPLLR